MIEIYRNHFIPVALSLLPLEMSSDKAIAMLLAIGLQESRFENRRQLPRRAGQPDGPARGFFQFEKGGGILGVSTHAATQPHLDAALCAMRYPNGTVDDIEKLYTIIEHNDIIACVCARLLLWTVPASLPSRESAAAGWTQYLQGWRPGEPHPQTWTGYFNRAWELV